jgi:hypothetical protein
MTLLSALLDLNANLSERGCFGHKVSPARIKTRLMHMGIVESEQRLAQAKFNSI